MNRYRIIFKLIIIVLAFLVQSMLFGSISYASVRPNLLLIITALSGFMIGQTEGIWVGFVCGLFWDISGGELLGYYALIFLIIGYLNGRFHNLFFDEDVRLPLLMVAVSDVTFGMIVCMTQFFLRGRFDFGTYLFRIILPETAFTVLLVLVLYPLIIRYSHFADEFEERRSGKLV